MALSKSDYYGDLFSLRMFYLRVGRISVFFWACKAKVPVQAIFCYFFGFLHGQNHGCTPTFFQFFGNFHAHFFFARPLFLFFARVTDTICTGTFLRICRAKLGFTAYLKGKWPKILHVHFLICTGVNYPKFARAKLVFHGHYFAIFRAFTRALFFCTGKNWKFCTGQLWFCTPKKNTGS